MAQGGERATSLSDYAELLALLSERGEEAVIVGGHAVNLWAEMFAEEESELASFLPFMSEDLDLHQPSLGVH